MQKDKITTQKIAGILVVFFLFFGIVFGCFKGGIRFHDTLSYLEAEDYTIGDIKVKGVQLKVYQNTGSGYTDVTENGFDLNTDTFATDKKYTYDLIIKNDEKATVTADQYYLRWYFTALVDNTEYDITKYTTVDSAYVYFQDDTDGKSRYYSVNGSQSNVISAQNQLTFLSSIRFDGVYDNLTNQYGSILDDEFAGSKIKIISHIEGSLTPYEIIYPTIKFFDADGSLMEEKTLEDGVTSISIPNTTPTSSIEVDGETLYFQGWTKNGQSNVLYTPNQTVDAQPNDVFTPYYGVDPDYSDFTFTIDSVTGEYILAGANSNMTSATIPALYKGDKVTVIKDKAFYSYTKLDTVSMPQTITKIEGGAFYNCASLTSITIPDSVTSIGNSAFYKCTSLTSITIGNSVTSIGYNTFGNCQNLTSITIGNSVTSIGDSAFFKCTSLTSITIPDSVRRIGNNCFNNCSNLTNVTFKNTTGWYATTSSSYTGGSAINVRNSATNATNMKSSSGSWYSKYLYRA